MTLPTLDDIKAAATLIRPLVPPTPQYAWPLLARRTGARVVVKHENHTPVGAFKIRGGLVYLDHLRRTHPDVRGLVSATRGNHGQSLAFACARHKLPLAIVVPHGNSVEKNAAMDALGAKIIEKGRDFHQATKAAAILAEHHDLHQVPSYHPALVTGVATYALELFQAVPDLETVYVPIGLGSGISGLIAVRDALGLDCEIVGVVSEHAPAYALSVAAGMIVKTDTAETMADGIACRAPDPDALAVIRAGAARIVRVTDAEIRAAMVAYFTDTHNVAEGAGAAPLAALIRERDRQQGRRVGLILSGGNVDRDVFARVLAEA